MCGRFAFYSPAEATAALFGAETVHDFKPRFNIAPTQDIAAIRRSDTKGVEMTSLRWGLVPFWAKDPSIGNRMINARAETVAEKPSFRTAFRVRRCLIPASGYYEWRSEGTGKQAYHFTLGPGRVFAMAGLWESQLSPDGSERETCTILTTESEGAVRQIHHRMPVILPAEHYPAWLDNSAPRATNLLGLLTAYHAGDLTIRPIPSPTGI